jgi:hypothetical protein
VVAVIMSTFRSGSGACVHPTTLRREARGVARAVDARKLWATLLLAALVILPLGVVPTFGDEIEPEPEPATEAEPAHEPAPAPEPQPEPKAKPAQEPVAKAVLAPEDDGMLPSRWIPSIETGFETFDYNNKTTVTNLINPPAWESTQHEASRQLMYRIGGDVMGPAFEDLPGKPRLFVQGGVQLKTFSAEKISAIADPTVAGEPTASVNTYYLKGNYKGENLPTAFVGQGNEVYAEFQRPSWYAGLGVAFSVPIADNLLLQLKPSLQYSMEKIDVTGVFATVNETTPPGVIDADPCGTSTIGPPCSRIFTAYQSRGNTSTTDRSLGAGMEVALALFRKVRPIRVSLYAEARFMWLLSGSTTSFSDPGNIAVYSVSRDNFGIKGGGGVRLSWVGFE